MQPWARRGEQRADIPGVDPLLAGLLEVDAEPEVVLDLDEQVGQPDSATAGVQPAVQLGEALRLRRVGLLGRVRLQPPPCVVERDLPVVSDTLQEAVERIRQAGLQVVDRRVGVDGESGARPERLADPLPLGGGQEEGLEAAEVLRALDGEVAGLELVAHLEEQRALPASAVRHAVAADERLQRRWREVERHIGRQAAAPRRAVFAVGPQRRQRRRGVLGLLVDELHPAQKRRGELAQPGVPLRRLLEAGLPVAPRPVRQVGLVLAQLLLRHDGQQSGPQPVVDDVRIEQHGAKPPVALNDPVDGVALRLEHVVEAVFDPLPIAVEELAVHVDGLVERVAPRLVQEAHQREVAARGGHLAHPVGRRSPDAVEQDPLIVPVDPAHVDVQHAGRLDRFQPCQKSFHAPDRRARRAGLDAVQGRVRLVVADGDQRIEAVAHRRRQTLRHALRQQGAGLVPGCPHRTAKHRVGRRENVFVAKPASRPRQQRRRAVEP